MRKIILTLSVVLAFVFQAAAQDQVITGRVTDQQGAGIEGVSVITLDGKTGTQTLKDGSYRLVVSANARNLTFSAINFEATTRAISGNVLNVSLVSLESKLQEVVVTALGIVRDKRSLGYATQTLKSDQIADRGEVNIVNALQGKIAGVSITNASGAAGASTTSSNNLLAYLTPTLLSLRIV